MGVLSFISDLNQLKQSKMLAEQELADREAARQQEGFRQQAMLAGQRELENLRTTNAQKVLEVNEAARLKAQYDNLYTLARSRGMDDQDASNFARSSAAQFAVQKGLTTAAQEQNDESIARGYAPHATGVGNLAGLGETERQTTGVLAAQNANAQLRGASPRQFMLGEYRADADQAEARARQAVADKAANIASGTRTTGLDLQRSLELGGAAENKLRQMRAETEAQYVPLVVPEQQRALATNAKMQNVTNDAAIGGVPEVIRAQQAQAVSGSNLGQAQDAFQKKVLAASDPATAAANAQDLPAAHLALQLLGLGDTSVGGSLLNGQGPLVQGAANTLKKRFTAIPRPLPPGGTNPVEAPKPLFRFGPKTD